MRRHFLLFLMTVLFSSGCHKGPDNNDNGAEAWKKSVWLGETFGVFTSLKYPRIRAISYWHERFNDKQGNLVDLRINSSDDALKAYQTGVRDPIFVTKPNYLLSQDIARLVPPPSGIYLSAFPDFGGSEDQVSVDRIRAFTDLSQHEIAWAYFSNNWYNEIKFPKLAAQTIHDSGHVPFIRMMMRSDTNVVPDPKYNLQMILDGKFDADLKVWAQDALALHYPILVEFGPEPNGDWFPWSGKQNGAGDSKAYKDPKTPDGPTRFKLAYRHIIDICRAEHVNNITWFFHANAGSMPDEPWNAYKNYYPGDDYIDWIGLSVYGPQRGKLDAYEPFSAIMEYTYPQISSLSASKPIAILEWGITEYIAK